jgi:hypothetical protein
LVDSLSEAGRRLSRDAPPGGRCARARRQDSGSFSGPVLPFRRKMANDGGGGFYGRLKSITTQDLADFLEEAPIEGTQLELKGFQEDPPGSGKLTFPPEDQSDVLSSLANTAGGREILGGLEDRAERLVGYQGVPGDRRRALLHRLNGVAARCQPPLHFDAVWVEAPDEKGWVLIVDVPPRKGRPHQSVTGRYLQRVNSIITTMSDAALTDAIVAASKTVDRPGWVGQPMSAGFPFREGSDTNGHTPDDWWVAATVRAPYPVEKFFDGAGDVMAIEQAFLREGVEDRPVLQRHGCEYVAGKQSIRVKYNLSVSVYRRGRGAPGVTTKEILGRTTEVIGRAARLLSSLGYEGQVEVHCGLSQKGSHTLLLRDNVNDSRSRSIAPHTWECLDDDLLVHDLRRDDLVAQLAQRFLVCVERNPDPLAR